MKACRRWRRCHFLLHMCEQPHGDHFMNLYTFACAPKRFQKIKYGYRVCFFKLRLIELRLKSFNELADIWCDVPIEVLGLLSQPVRPIFEGPCEAVVYRFYDSGTRKVISLFFRGARLPLTRRFFLPYGLFGVATPVRATGRCRCVSYFLFFSCVSFILIVSCWERTPHQTFRKGVEIVVPWPPYPMLI